MSYTLKQNGIAIVCKYFDFTTLQFHFDEECMLLNKEIKEINLYRHIRSTVCNTTHVIRSTRHFSNNKNSFKI